MNLHIEASGNRTPVVVLSSANLDAGNIRDFREAVEPILADHDNLILDMEQVTFVDSSGLGALLACLRLLQGKHGDLTLCALTKPVKALFDLVRMNRVFQVYPTREAALLGLSAS